MQDSLGSLLAIHSSHRKGLSGSSRTSRRSR